MGGTMIADWALLLWGCEGASAWDGEAMKERETEEEAWEESHHRHDSNVNIYPKR